MNRNRRISFMVALGLLITVLIGINARQTIYRLIGMNNWVVHTYLVLNKTQRILALLTNMDNDLRGYLQSNNPYFKSDFEHSSHEMTKQLKSIQVLTIDNSIQTKRLQLLDTLFQSKLASSRSLFKAGGIQQGKPRLDSIAHFLSISSQFYQVLKATESYENVLLETRVAQSERSASYATISNLVGAITALIMILWAIYMLFQSLQKSTRLNQQLTESEQQTKKLLDAVPVSVVIINQHGQFYYANQAASQLIDNITEFTTYSDALNRGQLFRYPEGEPYPIEQRPTFRALKGEPAQADDLEFRVNGKAIQLLSTASPVYDAQGQLQYVITSSIDISERVQSQKRLQEARKIAEKAAKVKEDFLANMSHEIRTPLNAMLGFSELLDTTVLDQDQKEFVRLIRTAGKNLLTIVNDILDISKLEAGMIKLESIPFSIQMLTASLRSMCQASVSDKGLQLIVKVDPDLPTIFLGDPTRLTQIILNLLNNAIKFTKHGHITLRVEQGEKATSESVRVRFIVQDTGIGIAPDMLPTIFERFQQADDFTTRYYGGTGLGLNIVKALTELQGGSVTVTSTPGKGSQFIVEIPYLIAKEQISVHQAPVSTTTPIEGNVRVLVVEDNLMNQKLVLQVLKRLGYQAQVAADGQKALDLLNGNSFDVILMDLQMPVMDGYETTRQIRSKLKSTIPIIAMTAHALPSEQEECLKVGMNDFLPKPFQMEELQLLLRKYLSVKISDDSTSTVDGPLIPPTTSFSVEPLLKAVGNDQGLTIELLDIYLEETPPAIDQLKLALDRQDIDEIKRIIHTQQVHTKMLGMSEATRLILETEALIGAKKDFAAISPLVGQYIKEVETALPLIEQYVQTTVNHRD
ncbi:ATP-binding protein [Spirosoma sp. KCTC 42546]|uniref:ATP-binding protein n=1 Tax=Spirosoma sp. KCTC 42546 TaxID=2520506 RepID=UPI001FEDB915|nr:ATP-binding protein [Spirosoma sp. KCTC 42546]